MKSGQDAPSLLPSRRVARPKKGIAAAGNWTLDRVKVIEEYPQEERLTRVLTEVRAGGGGAHNVLLSLARMKAPFPLRGIGCVGADEEGRWLIQEARENGVDFGGIRVTPEALTSFTDVMTVKSTGKRTFFHCPGANNMLEEDDIDAWDSKMLHIGYLLLLEKVDPVAPAILKKARADGVRTSVDLVSAEKGRFAEVVTPCLEHIDVLVINEVEAGATSGHEIRKPDGSIDEAALAASAKALFRDNLVVIHLPEMAYALRHDGVLQVPSRKPKEIVSTVGAGDAFAAGLLYGLHEEWPLIQCLDLAHAAAGACLGHETTTGGLRPIDEL